MAETKTEVCNMALGHLGQGVSISDIETEQSGPANYCRTFFDTAFDATLRDFKPPFADQVLTLGLLTELDVDDTHPSKEWQFSYAYPSDCVSFDRIQSGIRNETRQDRVPFRVINSSGKKVIMTDQEDAIGEFTFREAVVSNWTPDFTLAFSYLLANLIAAGLTGGDPFRLGDNSLKKYNWMKDVSKATALNERQQDEPQDSEFIRARDS